jgi:cephalosporin hydroxylase
MTRTRTPALIALIALALSACAPLVVAGAGAVVADAVVEESQGGDGLF